MPVPTTSHEAPAGAPIDFSHGRDMPMP